MRLRLLNTLIITITSHFRGIDIHNNTDCQLSYYMVLEEWEVRIHSFKHLKARHHFDLFQTKSAN